ncbi:ABC transporter ATP-binding protein [Psychrobacillus sp. FJAT-51614]|uniref:ABC transporter ATP-binding protein n=1 Tax=Psychrobacillus mangrovi TaxID=3117745 RepID=A0ABU8F557_9BACI
MMKVIECQHVKKSYRKIHALEDITFQIEDHKITGLIGRNGAGKTTLLKILAGFVNEDTGDVRVFSNHPFNNLCVSANSILVDNQMSFPDSLTLADILEIAPSFYSKWDAQLAARLFHYFNLNPKQQHSKLSTGTRGTFNMIFGLATRCELTMFDEPTNGMDEAVRTDFYRALLKEYIAHPRTILISSHHLAEIEHLLEDILLIHKGKVVFHKSLEEVKEYAVGIQGPIEKVIEFTSQMEILHTKQMNDQLLYTVVKKDGPMNLEGVSTKPISPSDICMYITSDSKGGIDDVFN